MWFQLTAGDHPHVHGANLGVRCDAYLRAGGWREIELSEDHGLWDRMREAGCQLVADRAVRVTTSGRSRSRCPGGFADALNKLAGIEFMTPAAP